MDVSLCITCWHKDIHYLGDLLDSLRLQTVQPNEIIVVGNNIPSPPKLSDHIKSFFLNERKPVSWSRNKCAELASKDIVIFFDVDDIMHPQKIELTKQVFETTDADCFVHGFLENSMALEHYESANASLITELLPQGYLKIPNGTNRDLHHGHLSVYKDIILNNRFNEFLGFYELGFQYWGEDSEICNRLFNSGYKFYYSNCKLVNYRPSYKDNERFWYIP